MADSTDIEPSSADLRAIELVYDDDLDTSARERLQGEADRDAALSQDVAAYGSLRQLFGELRDEDPPAAISAKLLQAAAQQAPASPKSESEGFLATVRGFFVSLAAHPGLAAAASLVVVAGVAGTLYVTGNGGVAQPGAVSPARERSAPAAEAKEGLSPLEELEFGAEGDEQPAALSPFGAADLDDSSADISAPGTAPAKSSVSEQKGSRSSAGSSTRALRPKEEKAPTRKRDYRQDKDNLFKRDSLGGSGAGSSRTEEVASGPAKKSVGIVPSAEPAPVQEGVSKELDGLYREAQTAANRSDCETVRAAGSRIRKQDSQFYDTVFLRNSAIAACYQTKR